MVTPHHTACPRVPYGGFTSRPVSRVGSTWSLLQDPPGESRYRTAHGMPARGDMVAAQVGVWVRGGFPQQLRLGSKLRPSLQVLQHPATAGGHKGRMPRVISTRLHCSCLDRPVSPHTSGFGHYYSLPQGPRPRASGGQNTAQRHTSMRSRGCSTGGVWVRGGFPQQRRLGSKLHPSLQVLQHPATAGGQWGVVTPCHTARLMFAPRGPREEVPASGFRSYIHANLPSARSLTRVSGGKNVAQRHASARARGCGTGGVWVRGGFPQQRRLGSKLHPSLQVLQHPATAGGQWGVVTPCHTTRLVFSPRGPHDEVPTSGFRSHVHTNPPALAQG